MYFRSDIVDKEIESPAVDVTIALRRLECHRLEKSLKACVRTLYVRVKLKALCPNRGIASDLLSVAYGIGSKKTVAEYVVLISMQIP